MSLRSAGWLILALSLTGGCSGAASNAEAPRPEGCEPRLPAAVAAARQVPVAELPALTGRVVDRADLLGPQEEAELTALSERLEARTTDQLVVVTVPSLNGRPIEVFGIAVGNHWGIGQRERDNGVLLIVAPSERRTRIEVGYGLERVLPDELARTIIERDLLPRFREGRFPAGILAGTRAIVGVLTAQADVERRGGC